VILVADDDQVMRRIVCAVLRESGHAILEACDGSSAVEMARAQRPDLIVLDIEMPGKDGFEVCAEVRSDATLSDTPVLMLTGREDSDSIRRAFEVGATDFASKPLSAALLSHRVRFMLRSVSVMRELRESESRLADAQRLARLGNWEWDVATGTFAASPEALVMLGLDGSNPQRNIDDLKGFVSAADLTLITDAFRSVLHGVSTLDVAFDVVLPDGRERRVHVLGQSAGGRAVGDVRITGTLQDITERTNAENRIRSLAYYDGLTELPNRALFTERARMAMALTRRSDKKLALLLLDLDNFKGINDTLGHSAGDKVLREVGARLRRIVREYDLVSGIGDEELFQVARLGGDEFLIAAGDLRSGEEAAAIAARILDELRAPLMIDDNELFIAASIGISVFPDDGADFEELFKNADVALYHAKDAGRNTSEFFSASMNEAAMHRLLMENSLRRSLERNEMTVHYQPQFDVVSGGVLTVEALMRWTNPDMGAVSPKQFIPLAERIGMIGSLTEFVMTRASMQLAQWHEDGNPTLRLAVNLSAQLFRNPDMLYAVCDIPARCGVDPAYIELEITETALLDNPADAERILASLRLRGFRIALDDFGVGFSSLSHLRQFALDTLKIDRSFVHHLVGGTRERAIVGALINLAHQLGIEPVAEGVEEPAQRDLLIAKGCRIMQGYLLGRPQSADAFTALLRNARQSSSARLPVRSASEVHDSSIRLLQMLSDSNPLVNRAA
jgi:diguanylate cyclase (GGDEF)-like protein